jgi:4-hydroxybenzoate polyprenyltransferase
MIFNLIRLMRIKQWYKNLLILLPLIFAEKLFVYDIIPYIIGFLALCLTSSSYYVLNDIIDYKNDRVHPEKRRRPIASGKVSVNLGIILFLLLITLSLLLSLEIGLGFLVANLILFLLTLLYIFWLKHIAFLDIIVISINFLIRTISGAYVGSNSIIPRIEVSSWLILSVFFLALFLTSSKREADLILLEDKAGEHKRTLKVYNLSITGFITGISITMLLVVYSLYSVLVQFPIFLITIPIALYCIIRYFYLMNIKSTIIRHPELFYTDKQLLLGVILWAVTAITIIYIT